MTNGGYTLSPSWKGNIWISQARVLRRPPKAPEAKKGKHPKFLHCHPLSRGGQRGLHLARSGRRTERGPKSEGAWSGVAVRPAKGPRAVGAVVTFPPKGAGLAEGVPEVKSDVKDLLRMLLKLKSQGAVATPSTGVAPAKASPTHPAAEGSTRKGDSAGEGTSRATGGLSSSSGPAAVKSALAMNVGGPFGDALQTLARLWVNAQSRPAGQPANDPRITELEHQVKCLEGRLELAQLYAILANEAKAEARANAEESVNAMLQANVLNSNLGQEVDELKKANKVLRKRVAEAEKWAKSAEQRAKGAEKKAGASGRKFEGS